MDETTQPQAADEADVSAANFGGLGEYMLRRFEALRELHAELSPTVEDLDDFKNAMAPVGDALFETGGGDKDAAMVARKVAELLEARVSMPDFVRKVWELTTPYTWGPEFTITLMKALTRPRRGHIFQGAMLSSVVSTFESFLGNLAREYYKSRPEGLIKPLRKRAPRSDEGESIPTAEKEFSLQDLQQFKSIQDAVDHAIETRVESLGYYSLTEWRTFFVDRMSIDMKTLGPGWDDIREVFERRHCVVHNEGRVSRRYAREIGGAEVDARLDLSTEYVGDAIDALEAVACELLTMAWSKFEAEDEPASWLTHTGFEALKADRWVLSHHLFQRRGQFPMDRETEQINQVNLWLAEKGLNGTDSVRAEVEAWDLSGLFGRFRFARACLLDDLDTAFDMLPGLIEANDISVSELAEWPLTHGLRQDPRIREFGDDLQASIVATSLEEVAKQQAAEQVGKTAAPDGESATEPEREPDANENERPVER
jgi:hypothetical protein